MDWMRHCNCKYSAYGFIIHSKAIVHMAQRNEHISNDPRIATLYSNPMYWRNTLLFYHTCHYDWLIMCTTYISLSVWQKRESILFDGSVYTHTANDGMTLRSDSLMNVWYSLDTLTSMVLGIVCGDLSGGDSIIPFIGFNYYFFYVPFFFIQNVLNKNCVTTATAAAIVYI